MFTTLFWLLLWRGRGEQQEKIDNNPSHLGVLHRGEGAISRAITIIVSGASATAKAAVEAAGGSVTTTVAVKEKPAVAA